MSLDKEKQSAAPPPDQSFWQGRLTVGNNGVAAAPRQVKNAEGYRSYEIYQRQRVRQSTEKLKPSNLISDDYRSDPFPILATLRENYPCYRDWLGNAYWVTRYDDVTSIFTDDANFETRSKLWTYGLLGFGRDLRFELPVLTAQAHRMDAGAEAIARRIVSEFAAGGTADLALDFAARLAIELLGYQFGLPADELDTFAALYWRAQRGTTWEPQAQADGKQAIQALTDFVRPLFEARRADPGDDVISAIATLDLEGGPATAEDVATTVLEADHKTLHGALANMWFLLLTHPDQLARVADETRLLKYAYYETLRHSPPVLSAKRFARHEVERFGQLLPEGALLICSAAAANRDPRVFENPDLFRIDRKDVCQREPRGQYRADGLASGIAFGLGPPSKFPALPEDRPRSLYALTRDSALTASRVLLEELKDLKLAGGAAPALQALRVGDMHTCWHLPMAFRKR